MDINRRLIKDENVFSGIKKGTVEDFVKDWKQYEVQRELIEQFEKNPITESQWQDFFTTGKSEIDSAKMDSMYRGIGKALREDGLLIPDPQISFAEFKEKFPEHNVVKASWIAHFTRAEYGALTAVGAFKVFQDISEKYVLHYQYSTGKGGYEKTGDGIGVMLRTLTNSNSNPAERKELIAEKTAYYKQSRKEIGAFLESIGLVPKEKDRVFNGQGGFKSIEAKEMANKGPNVHLRGVSDVFSTANKSKIMQKRK